MNIESLFQCFSPNKFLPLRYSPICILITEPSVNSYLKDSNITFDELLSSFGATSQPPIRMLFMSDINQVDFQVFHDSIIPNLNLFSKAFSTEEFEKNGNIDQQLANDLSIPSNLKYPSNLSMNPPWYSSMISKLFSSELFSDMDFCDFPFCIAYVSIAETKCLSAKDIKNRLKLPKWMQEYQTQIPILHLIIHDKKGPKYNEAKNLKGDFDDKFVLTVNTREQSDPPVEQKLIQKHFALSPDFIKRPGFCSTFNDQDFRRTGEVVFFIYSKIKSFIDSLIQNIENEVMNAKQIKNRLKEWLKKGKKVDKTSAYMNVPLRKLIRIKLASLYMITGRYREARKMYKEFYMSLKNGIFPDLRIFGEYMANIAIADQPDEQKKFHDGIQNVLNNIGLAGKNIRFIMMVPTLVSEIYAANMEYDEAMKLLILTIDKIMVYWNGNPNIRIVILAMLYERIAGLSRLPKKSVFYTAKAGLLYKQSNQILHSLRCSIWTLSVLPRDSWQFLYQYEMLNKSQLLSNIQQWDRVLENCKELLSLPDLHKSLHEQVILLFWTPFNAESFQENHNDVHINSLLKVGKLSLYSSSFPEYWGYDSKLFKDIIEFHDSFLRTRRISDLSFKSLWFDGVNNDDVCEEYSVNVGEQIIVRVPLYNRYKFSIHLKKAVLFAEYEGNENKNGKYCEVEEITNQSVPGMTIEPKIIEFKIVPLCEGTFIINRFKKNYWDYVETEVKCGPLKFKALNNYPKISMKIIDFPTEAYEYQTFKFNIKITNTGKNPINNLSVLYDHSKWIIYESQKEEKQEYGVIQLEKPLEISQSTNLSLILVAKESGIFDFHFLVAADGIRCFYNQTSLNVSKCIQTYPIFYPKTNDICDSIFYCFIQPLIDNIEILGFIDSNGKYMKTLEIPSTKLNKDQSIATAVFLSNDNAGKEVEHWRKALIPEGNISLLFKVNDSNIYSQKNFKILNNVYDNQQLQLALDMKSEFKVKLGTRLSCKVYLKNIPEDPNFKFYLTPSNFQLVDDFLVSKKYDFNACQWLGITKILFEKANNWSGTFYFVPFKYGLYKIPSFFVSFNSVNQHEIKLMNTIQITQE